jgi:Domain of unknown function (DUF4175)
MTPAQDLHALARRLRMERAFARVLVCVAGATAYAGIIRAPAAIALGLGLGIMAAMATDRFRRINADTVAQHLDRVLPELEESAGLLLAPLESLGSLARLQRARLSDRWDARRVRAAAPHGDLRRGLLLSMPLLIAGSLLLMRGTAAPPVAAAASPAAQSDASPEIQELTLDVRPPAYTGDRARRAGGNDTEVQEGSRLTWRTTIGGPVAAAWLNGSAGDSLPFRIVAGTRWEVESRATQSQIYQAIVISPAGGRAESGPYRVAVRPDRPPTVTVLRPGPRTELDPGRLAPVPVDVLASDDYGLGTVEIRATIASGHGEAVRFRRLRIPFTTRLHRGDGSDSLATTLDPAALHLGPGDEVNFSVEASDQREPVPNRTRSTTAFIVIRDTAVAPAADFAAMAMGAEPEYFRSQRQIIIDTEKLLADRRRLAVVTFRDRSNGIGIDQGLLRLRYGQFLGEEFEENEGGPGHEVHQHDNPENATLLGPSVKERLRAAVGAMWQAELALRIAEPAKALPYETRALDLIKQIQQEARVYVQRVGFEPAPIEVNRIRLTGKLEGIRDREAHTTGSPRDSLPAIRALLREWNAPAVSSRDRVEALEAAGRELAHLAVLDARYLPLLADLHRFSLALKDGRACEGCGLAVERGLWRAVPPAEPLAPAGVTGTSPIGQQFSRLLAEPSR